MARKCDPSPICCMIPRFEPTYSRISRHQSFSPIRSPMPNLVPLQFLDLRISHLHPLQQAQVPTKIVMRQYLLSTRSTHWCNTSQTLNLHTWKIHPSVSASSSSIALSAFLLHPLLFEVAPDIDIHSENRLTERPIRDYSTLALTPHCHTTSRTSNAHRFVRDAGADAS